MKKFMNKDSNPEIISFFEKNMFNVKHGIEKKNKYDSKIFILHNTLDEIKTYLNNQIFVNKFQKMNVIIFLSRKSIMIINKNLSFFDKEDKDELIQYFLGILVYTSIICEKNELYEIQSNIIKFVKESFGGNIEFEIEKMKKDKSLTF